jgi:hypothetical protein
MALLAASAVLAGMLATLGAAPASAAGVTTEDLCSAPTPGYAQCLGIRRVSSPGVTANSANRANSAGLSPATTPSGLRPADLLSAYRLDSSSGTGQTVAVVDAFDDPTAEADLAAYRSQWGLSPCSTANHCFAKVNETGQTSPLPSPDDGWAGEISLDLDMVSAVCPNCGILLVEADTNSILDLGTAVDTAVALGAKFVSNSYGGPEQSWASQVDPYYNHPGVAITASTGDLGYGVSYPASSPYVTAVGGTSLTRNGGSWSEAAWDGAGSGCSSYSVRPSFQSSVSTGCGNRAVADVSAVADPMTGVAVYNSYSDGGWVIYGGTSAASPIIAATYALAGAPGPTDYPNSYPYAHSVDLTDVTTGSNGSGCAVARWCAASAGWDGPTGLGTPNSVSAFSAPVALAASQLSAVLSQPASYYGDPVTVAGALTVTSDDGPVAVAGASVSISETTAAGTIALATAVTQAGGGFSAVIHPTASGTIQAAAAASSARAAATASAGALTVQVPRSVLTASVSASTVAYLAPVTVSGSLTRLAGSASRPLTGATVRVLGTVSGAAATQLGVAVVNAQGRWSVAVAPRASQTISATYSGAAGQPSASVSTGPVRVAPWTTRATVAASRRSITAGDPIAVTGTVTRSYNGASSAAGGLPVRIYLTTSTKASVLLASTTTNSAGRFSVVARPTENGTLVARVLPVAGYMGSNSAGIAMAARTKVAAVAPVRVARRAAFILSASVVVARKAALTIQVQRGGRWVRVASGTTAVSGVIHFRLAGLAPGTYRYRAVFAGDRRGAAAVSPTIIVRVL